MKNPMPSKGGERTGIFSSKGSQKKDPLGSGFKPELVTKVKTNSNRKPATKR